MLHYHCEVLESDLHHRACLHTLPLPQRSTVMATRDTDTAIMLLTVLQLYTRDYIKIGEVKKKKAGNTWSQETGNLTFIPNRREVISWVNGDIMETPGCFPLWLISTIFQTGKKSELSETPEGDYCRWLECIGEKITVLCFLEITL